jgi:hypothetical protein
MNGRSILALALVCAWLLPACGPGDAYVPVELPPAEVFHWGGQPFSASPPPEGWRCEKEQSGGLRGVRFIKSGSVGEEIRLAEHYALDDRDRCDELAELLRDLDNLSHRGVASRIQKAKLYARPPINADETLYADEANRRLDEARHAVVNGREADARRAVKDALDTAAGIRYSLDDVIDHVMFSPSSYDAFGTVVAAQPSETRVGGERAVQVDFTLDGRDRRILYHGRQVYVARNNRLFVLTYLGLPENLPLFEQVVQTVSFPPGRCEH